MKYNKGFAPLILVAIIVGALVIGGGVYYLGKSGSKQEVKNPENILPSNQNQNLPVDNNQQVTVTNPIVVTGCTSSSVPSITVLSPNGGEVYKVGDKITVKWSSCNIPATHKFYIGLMPNVESQGSPAITVLSASTINDGVEIFNFNINDTDLSSYTIFMKDNDLPNGSTNTWSKKFTINSSPVSTANWKTYSNTDYGFSFNYPSSWKQPILSQQSTRNIIDFSNGFSIVTGFNYDQTKGGNSTITEITNSYAKDNNFQNVKTQNLKIDGHLATKISYYGIDTKKNYTELYIYQDQQIQEKYIELVADDSVNGKVFDQITSSFKFIK